LIAYIDTSALLPLILDEPASPHCMEIWESAERLVATRLVEIEAATALHRAHRLGRLNRSTLLAALRGLDAFLTDLDLLEIDQALVQLARRCAAVAPLKGYDAMHCAAGLLVSSSPGAALVSGDHQLLAAWRQFGAPVVALNEATG
jgi:uncharacterized protein